MMYELCYMNEFELDLDENLHRYFQHKAHTKCARHICAIEIDFILQNANCFDYSASCVVVVVVVAFVFYSA